MPRSLAEEIEVAVTKLRLASVRRRTNTGVAREVTDVVMSILERQDAAPVSKAIPA